MEEEDLEPEASNSASVTQQIIIRSSESLSGRSSLSSSFSHTKGSSAADNTGYSSLPSSPSKDSINSFRTSWLATVNTMLQYLFTFYVV